MLSLLANAVLALELIFKEKKFFLKIQIYREEAVFDFSQPTPNVDNVVLKLNDGVVNVCRKVSLLFF